MFPSLTHTKGSISFDLKPRELRILEITDQGKLIDTMKQRNNFPIEVRKVLDIVPFWIKSDLYNQFKQMENRPIVPYAGSTPATGDLNNDGTLDLVVGSSKGFLRVFVNVGINQKTSLEFNTQIDYPQWKDNEINPAVFDLNDDGYADLVLGIKNKVYILFNKKLRNPITFSDPVLWFESNYSKGAEDNIAPCAVDIESKLGVIFGHLDGGLSLLIKENGKWQENVSYFSGWKNTGNSTPTVFLTNKNEYILVIGGKNGELDSFAITMSREKLRSMKSLNLLEKIKTPGDSSPAFYDVDNGRIDIIFCSNEEPTSFLLNKGTNQAIEFQIFNSDAEKNMTNNSMGGSSYNRDYDALYANKFNQDINIEIAKYLLSIEKKYLDEVAYCVANMQVLDLVSYVKFERLNLLTENVKEIYLMSSQVAYLKIKELDEATTLSYNTDSGWKDMPSDVYYRYLVMLNRYLLIPNQVKSAYHNNFFRSFLPYDKTYGISLFDRVKESKTLHEAAYQVMYWLKDDIGGVWCNGPKPPGWYNIYKNLTNPDFGLWCGEWAVIYEASARAMNIPTVSIVSLGEDHQFNNFWADGWHHVDASAGMSTKKGTWKPFFDNASIYFDTWGTRVFSWPMENEGNGKFNHVWRSEISYNPDAMLSNLMFIVKDKKGQPIDGARIEIWSHWSVDAKVDKSPYITAFGFTDSDGEATITKLGPQNYTVIVVTRIGSKSFSISLKKSASQMVEVTIDQITPTIYPFETIPISSIQNSTQTINRSFQIVLSNFTQNNFPISDVYNTMLQYVNVWKQSKGNAKVYLLSSSELENLKTGLPLESGEERTLVGFDQISFKIPVVKDSSNKYYLVFWNPNFATEMKVKVE
jgi:hypothetical protein